MDIMKKTTGLFFGLEMLVVLLMIADLIPQFCAYLVIAILLLALVVLNKIEFLKLYIYSIPFFVVMPPNPASDSMSIWRVIILFWFIKITFECFNIGEVLKRPLAFGEKIRVLVDNIKEYFIRIQKANYYRLVLLVFAFGLICFVSLFFAESIGVGAKKIIFISSAIMLFPIVMYSTKSKDDYLAVIQSILYSALMILFVGYFQLALTFFWTLSDFWGFWYTYIIRALYGEKMMILLSYSNTWFSYYDNENLSPTLRMFSVMPDSHSFAMLMILFSPIAIFYYALSKQRKNKIVFVSLLFLFLLAIFFSGSRGAWAGWVVAFAFSVFIYLFRKKITNSRFMGGLKVAVHKKHYRMVAVSLLLFVFLFPVSAVVLQKNQEVQMVMEGRAVDGGRKLALLQRTWSIYDLSETSNKGRLQIWKESVESVAKKPLTGVGIGNFPVAIGEKLSTSKMGASAHNIYLDIIVEIGVFGLLVFLLIILEIAKALFLMSNKSKRYSLRLFSAAFLVYFVWLMAYGFFDVVILNDKVLMFLVILLAIFYRIDQSEGENVPS